MARRRRAEKRKILPDARYKDLLLGKFINILMMNGEKSKAESIVYKALDIVKEKTKSDPIDTFHDALKALRPELEVRSRRVGGATYQVPVEVRPERTQVLAFRWLVRAARKRSETTMVRRLSAELLDAVSGRGSAIKKREEAHKMAESNRAFAHYRW